MVVDYHSGMECERSGTERSGTEPRAIRYRDVTLSAAVLGGQVDVRMAGGPWWAAFLLTVLGLVLGLVTVLVRIVFPQDSADKLAWWRDRRRTSRQRAVRLPSTRSVAPPSQPAGLRGLGRAVDARRAHD